MSKLRSTLFLAWMAAITAVVAFLAIRGTPQAQGALAAHDQPRKVAIDELDVHRINVVEPDGKPRVIITSRNRMPGQIYGGKDYRGPRTDVGGGLLFYNDEGTESGGLTYNTGHDGKRRGTTAALTMDQYDQNEQVALVYQQPSSGGQRAGLYVYADLPETSLLPVIQAWQRVQDARSPQDKQQAQAELRTLAPEGVGQERTRAFLGKEDESAKLVLGDRDGHPRIVLAVDPSGAPSIELLDAAGKILNRIAAP